MDDYISDLKEDFYSFIKNHISDDVVKLKLKYGSTNLGFPLDFALTQISLRSKNKHKLKSFLSHDRFLFPNSIASEQSSDELVASYNASIAGTGKKILDMTAGLGIDSMSMVLAGNQVTSVELDQLKCDVLLHNTNLLFNSSNHKIICEDSLAYAKSLIETTQLNSNPFDVVYVDPARRDGNNNRTYSFADCTPDIVANMNLLLRLAPKILVKASPLLDISQVFSQIPNAYALHIVSARGECKELLLEIKKETEHKSLIVANIDHSESYDTIIFSEEELSNSVAPILEEDSLRAGLFLYEPNPGLMKVTAYGALCKKFPGIKRISPNTSLYVSEELFKNFPGRKLRIESVVDKKEIKSLKGEKLNVSVRNYPLAASELSKKIKNREGDNRFLYAFRAYQSAIPTMVLATKI